MIDDHTLKNVKITSVVNTVLILIVIIFGFVLVVPFVIAKDANSIIISLALILSTLTIILYASKQIEKKNTELELKISELDGKHRELNEKHKGLEHLVARNTRIENMITSLISMFIEPGNIDGTLNEILKKTASFCNAEYCYLFLFKGNSDPYLSHGWKSFGLSEKKSVFENISYSKFPWISKKLVQKQMVHISKEEKLLEIADRERNIILSSGVKSLMIVPVESESECIGFISIENISNKTDCNLDNIQTLKVLSEIVSMALNHRSFLKDLGLFKNLIDRSNDFIFTIDMEKHLIIDANETACKELGYSLEELISMQEKELSLLFDDTFWKNDLSDLVGDRYLLPSQTLTRKNGDKIPVEMNITFATHDNHNYALAVVRDIAARIDMESRLAKTKQVMELAMEGADLGMWDWNLRTNEVMYNERWAEMIGYDVDDIEKNIESWKKLIHPDDIKTVDATVNEHIDGETPFFESEFRMKNSKDKWQWILARGKITEWDKNEEPFRFTGTTMDLDERKKVEEELRHSNELKDLFTDIMRHDLLNPAGNIKGFSEVLYEKEDDPGKSRIISSVQRNTDRLIDMIETAAKFAKLEATDELELKEVDIMASLHNVIEQFEHQLHEKNMKLDLRAEGKYPAVLNPIVEEIFANYISNAIKYSPENTKIIVDIANMNYEWMVTVTDCGEGIPDDAKPLVFDRFKRVNKSGVKGTGLGLAIVKKIAELLGGRVGVDDNPEGNGSMFWVRLKKHHEVLNDEAEPTIPIENKIGTEMIQDMKAEIQTASH
ncbi:ATP-binding protein [Methanolobus bombayensis]|uniref:sensor histidine kinase n=1 Tax=Methanolobus bombayensis TaxID=38023 RepID=UPI001AE5E41D|nr:ATP-binding protein [Methanolobus bombayensis]MBP1908711.1 PAS domain S-box-containing protein [Methanolobus bombayensis]